jgi:hypothetical protein
MRGSIRLRGRALVVGFLAACVVGVFAFAAIAVSAGTGTPANKATAAGDKAAVFSPGTAETILTAKMKTSKPEDLILQVTLECSIFTDVTVGGSNTSPAEAHGQVRVWVEVDGKQVPIQDISSPPQDPSQSGTGNDSDKVVFCDRLHRRSVSDTENDADGTDTSRDFQSTKSANAFNWVRLNTGSGDHTIVVKADLVTDSMNTATASAEIGNRTLVIEPTKLANDAVIANPGTS